MEFFSATKSNGHDTYNEIDEFQKQYTKCLGEISRIQYTTGSMVAYTGKVETRKWKYIGHLWPVGHEKGGVVYKEAWGNFWEWWKGPILVVHTQL